MLHAERFGYLQSRDNKHWAHGRVRARARAREKARARARVKARASSLCVPVYNLLNVGKDRKVVDKVWV